MAILCTICTSLVSPSEHLEATKCGHVFHQVCVRQWIERSKTCPQCRHETTENCLIRFFPTFQNGELSENIANLQTMLDDALLELQTTKAANKELESKLKKATDELQRNRGQEPANASSTPAANRPEDQNRETSNPELQRNRGQEPANASSTPAANRPEDQNRETGASNPVTSPESPRNPRQEESPSCRSPDAASRPAEVQSRETGQRPFSIRLPSEPVVLPTISNLFFPVRRLEPVDPFQPLFPITASSLSRRSSSSGSSSPTRSLSPTRTPPPAKNSPSAKNDVFICEKCDRVCGSRIGLYSHERSCFKNSINSPFELATKSPSSTNSPTAKISSPARNPPSASNDVFECENCGRICGSQIGLYSHEKSCMRKKSMNLSDELQQASTLFWDHGGERRQQSRPSTSDGPSQCHNCGRICGSRIGLYSHEQSCVRKNSASENFGMSTPRVQETRPRQQARSGSSTGHFSCSKCGRVCGSQIGLYSHQRSCFNK